MKKIVSIILSICMLLSLTLTGCAAEQAGTQSGEAAEIILQIGNPVMTVNGTEKPIDAEGTSPVIVNDRTLLPVRAVVEEMGGTVTWDDNTQTVTLHYGENEIKLVIENMAAYLNDMEQTLDVAPTIINDRTMLPIRFIAESFKFAVDWNEEEQKVTITKNADTNMTANDTEISENLVLINGGKFTMGSPSDEPERGVDETQHEVTVDSFYMAKTELSQKEYQNVMGSNPSESKGDNLPVTNITWYDAIQYCNALSEKEGLMPCYTISGDTITWNKTANGYRLPTEAEWEYAARANTTTPFSFGDYVQDEDANCYNAYGYNNDASGNWVNGYLEHTVAVDAYNTNNFGLYNMHGNAAEWVWDWYGEYQATAQINPVGSESGNYKVARGGGWNDFPKHIRSAYRMAHPADVPLYSIGLRPVRNAETGQGTVTSVNNAHANTEANKTLLVYFSQTNNTKGLAEMIAGMRDIDVFRIERKTPYAGTGNGTVLYGEALTEQRENAVPELKSYLEDAGLDIDDYDTILLGYCNWWASIPAPVRSFLNRYDLSGKTIIPFCSMGGGHFGQTISAVAKLAPSSAIKKGLEVTYSSYNRDEIEAWLTESGINNNDRTDGGSDKKSIVVYFSASADNTKCLAETMAQASDSDIARIVPEVAYTAEDLEYYNYDNRANTELASDARPAILPMNENFAQYDTIMLGYPIWHGQTPPAVRTFLDTYKNSLAGKTIIPFCTSGSTGISGSVPKIRELCPQSTVKNGFRGTASMSADAVMQQLKNNGFEEKEQILKIQVGNNTLTATLVDNSSTAALKELLANGPLTINMSDYGNFEKVGSLGTSLPTNNEQITTEAGDLILYQGNSFVIYYDTNSWSFTRLGKINNVTQAELKNILGSGSVTVTLSME